MDTNGRGPNEKSIRHELPSPEKAPSSLKDIETQHERQIQERPSELPNLAAEIICILVCSVGQLFYSILLGNVEVNQLILMDELQIPDSRTPWLLGSYLLGSGVSVSICGSIMDLVPPKRLLVGAFVWMAVWNLVGATTANTAARWPMFIVVRAMQGLSLGALVSGSISILGRLYQPGLRKTRAFSLMASLPPVGFSLGGLQGGALAHHQAWIFGTTGESPRGGTSLSKLLTVVHSNVRDAMYSRRYLHGPGRPAGED